MFWKTKLSNIATRVIGKKIIDTKLLFVKKFMYQVKTLAEKIIQQERKRQESDMIDRGERKNTSKLSMNDRIITFYRQYQKCFMRGYMI